jgi:hypothetical protein
MRYFVLAFFLLGTMLISSCCNNEPKLPEPSPQSGYYGLFVLNEGRITDGNASLDAYDEKDYRRIENIFYHANGGERMGDVAHNILQEADTLFVVMNYSKLLYKLQLPSFRILGRLNLPAGASPRTMIRLSPTKAYVNSLLDGTVYIFNPVSMTLLEKRIAVENYMEDMVMAAGKVFVSCGNYSPPSGIAKIAVIDPIQDAVLKYIDLPIENPGPILSQMGRLYVGIRGDYKSTGSGIAVINPATQQLDTVLRMSGSLYSMTAVDSMLYLINDSTISTVSLPTYKVRYNAVSRAQLGVKNNDLLYQLTFDTERQHWYLSNAGQGAINGTLHQYTRDFTPVRTLPTGIFPKKVFFYRQR